MSEWYYLANNNPKGPITELTLKEYFSANTLAADTLVWKDGMEGWVHAGQMPVFFPSGDLISANSEPSAETVSTAANRFPPTFPVTLVQRNFLRGQQTFELVNERLLRFQVGKGKKLKRGEVSLDTLRPQPQRIRKWDIGSLVLAVPMVLITLIIMVASIASFFSAGSGSDILSVFIVNGVVIVFTALLVGLVYVKRQNSIVFASFSGAPLTLWFENPDKATFEGFLAQFQALLTRVDRTQVAAEKIPDAPPVCAQCQSPEIISGYSTPLCEPCRNSLVNRPVPLWLRIAAGALVVLMLISAIRIPRELGASIDYERGQIAEQKGNYAAAAKEYQKALVSYPKSVDILCGLARSAHRSGDQNTAIQCVNQLITLAGPSGEMLKDTISVINEVKGIHP